MVIKKDGQFFISLNMEPAMFCTKVIALLVITFGILNFCTITITFCYQISTYLYNKKCPKIQVSEQVFSVVYYCMRPFTHSTNLSLSAESQKFKHECIEVSLLHTAHLSS